MTHVGLEHNPTLIGYPQDTRNWILACYTAHLAAGSTILSLAIKTDTIKRYLHAVAALFKADGQEDPSKGKAGARAPCVEAILQEALRWEKVPDRCEPLTTEMLEYIKQQALVEQQSGHIDGLYSTI